MRQGHASEQSIAVQVELPQRRQRGEAGHGRQLIAAKVESIQRTHARKRGVKHLCYAPAIKPQRSAIRGARPLAHERGPVTVAAEGAAAAGLGRRPLIKTTLGAALGLSALSPILLLRDLGPLPKDDLSKTSWKAGTRLVTDPGDRPLRPEDLEVGAVAQTLPEIEAGAHRSLADIGKDAVLLIRLRPEEFNLDAERLSWTHEGIIAFSKICSHMGCAVALYEQQTKHLLCPCHQSTFDVTRAAKVIFGPSARPLPQLAITVDADGYLVAQAPFNEPVGPSFWERSS